MQKGNISAEAGEEGYDNLAAVDQPSARLNF